MAIRSFVDVFFLECTLFLTNICDIKKKHIHPFC
jgi:hypothetical protein